MGFKIIVSILLLTGTCYCAEFVPNPHYQQSIEFKTWLAQFLKINISRLSPQEYEIYMAKLLDLIQSQGFAENLQNTTKSQEATWAIQNRDWVRLRHVLSGAIPDDRIEALIGYMEGMKKNESTKLQWAVWDGKNKNTFWYPIDKDFPDGDVVVFLSDFPMNWQVDYDRRINGHKGRLIVALEFDIAREDYNRIYLIQFADRYRSKFTAYIKGGGYFSNRDMSPPFNRETISVLNLAGQIVKSQDKDTPLGAFVYFDNGWSDKEWYDLIAQDTDFLYMWGMGYSGIKDFISPIKHLKEISGGKSIFWGSLCGNGRKQDIQKIKEAGYLSVCLLSELF